MEPSPSGVNSLLNTTASSPSVMSAGPSSLRGRLSAWLEAAALVLTAVGLAAVLVEWGFYRLPPWLPLLWVHGVQTAMAGLLLSCGIARAALAPGPWARWRLAMPEVLAVAFALAISFMLQNQQRWLMVVRIYALLMTAVYTGRLCVKAVQARIDASMLLIGGFAFLILAGTGLLLLPRAVPDGNRPLYGIDALFTATSAACVTGLTFLDTGSEFSRFGQWVILCLVQLGGLGIITAGTMLVLRGGRRFAQGGNESKSVEPTRPWQIVETVVLSTLLIELIGACLLVPVWGAGREAVFAALFHSVMAFCTAGFSLQKDSLISLREHWQVILIIPLLTILGSLGLPVLLELVRGVPGTLRHGVVRLLGLKRPSSPPRLSVQGRLLLAVMILLVAAGPVGILLLNPARTDKSVGQASDTMAGVKGGDLTDWQDQPLEQRLAQAWFQGIEAQSGGLVTMDLNDLTSAGKLWLILLMFVGGSPASAAGGLRTVTLAILVAVVWSTLRRRERVMVLGCEISPGQIRRVLTLTALYVAGLVLGTLALAVSQGPASRFMDVLFEAVSAFSTAGVSLGETLRLVPESRAVVVVLMVLGRLGPLVLAMALLPRGMTTGQDDGGEELIAG